MATIGRTGLHRNIVILGAGYAGVMAANRMLSSSTKQKDGQIRVTVVNARDRFVERIRLHELVAGTVNEVSMPLSEILHPDARVLVGSAYLIEPERNVVHVRGASGVAELDYDELVYAVGSTSAVRVPGVREYAFLVADPEQAARAAEAIAAVPSSGRVVVVGGGLTGVETASELAETRPDLAVTLLVGAELVAGFGSRSKLAVERSLRKLGVAVVRKERVQSVRDGELLLDSGNTLPFDACAWAGGFEVSDLATKSGLAVDVSGRLQVCEDLTSIDAGNIVGAGDCVVLPASNGAHLRMGCAVALPMGGHAAETVLHHLRGTNTAPASVGFLVQCLSLGRKRGIIQFVHADDSPKAFFLSGFVGARFKEYICKLTVSGPKSERTRPGAYKAPNGPTHKKLVAQV